MASHSFISKATIHCIFSLYKMEDSFKGINVVITQIGHQATRSHRLCCHGD